MIIEATLVLRDETLQGCTPSLYRGELNTSPLGNIYKDAKSWCPTLEESKNHPSRRHILEEKEELPYFSRSSKDHSKIRKSISRGHPYRRSRNRRCTNTLGVIFPTTTRLEFQPLFRQNFWDIHSNWETNSCKAAYSEGRISSRFTANANDNNDNDLCDVPCSSCFSLAKESPTPVAFLRASKGISDIEIDDITYTVPSEKITGQEFSNSDSRHRRKSLNTNPLSTESIKIDHQPLLVCLNDILCEKPKELGQRTNGIKRGEKILERTRESTSQHHTYHLRTGTSPSVVESIPDFAPTSNTVISTLRSSCLSSNIESDLYETIDSDVCTSVSSPRREGSERALSTLPCHNTSGQKAEVDLTKLIPDNSELLNFIKPRQSLDCTTLSQSTGGVHNNNGNAVSRLPYSKLSYSEQCFSWNKPVDTEYRKHEHSKILYSPRWSFPIEKGNHCSLSQHGAKSVILKGVHSSGDLFQSSIHATNLHSSFKTRISVSGRSDSRLQTHKQTTASGKSYFNKKERGGEEFLISSSRTGSKNRKVVSLSANNHHNSPWFSSENRSFEKNIGEKTSSLECIHLHTSRFDDSCFRRFPAFLSSDPSRKMGCIQSIAKAKVSPDRCHHSVIVEDIQAVIDRTPTEIEEKSPIVLRYRTPYFRASAQVIVPPISRKETWTVGWIQACDSMKFINQYGNLGSSSWEIPALKDRRITAVSDSDGVSYPWYGNTTEIATVEGPTETSRSLTLRMNDNFYPSVTWDIPVSEGSEAHLTHIVRDQSFTTWLAAVNQTTGRLEVLRTVKWHFYLEINVDPTQELGKRARIVSPLVQKQPIVLKNDGDPVYISSPHRSGSSSAGNRHKRLNRRPGAGGDNNSNNRTNFIPKSALVRPSANNAQTLIWRPTRDIPVIVVPAKEEYRENNEVVWFTRTPTLHEQGHNVRVLSLQEMYQLKNAIS